MSANESRRARCLCGWRSCISKWSQSWERLRTVTVVAAGGSGISLRRALPPLILGSSIFLQLHLVLGMVLGPLAGRAFDHATGPTLVALVVLVAAAVVFWLTRRGRRGGAQAWTEAACPACLGLALLAERLPEVALASRVSQREG